MPVIDAPMPPDPAFLKPEDWVNPPTMKSPIDTSKDNVAMGIMMPDTELISIITASAIFCANSPALIGSGVDDIIGPGLKANILNQLLLFKV
jgi:hypothetical protein